MRRMASVRRGAARWAGARMLACPMNASAGSFGAGLAPSPPTLLTAAARPSVNTRRDAARQRIYQSLVLAVGIPMDAAGACRSLSRRPPVPLAAHPIAS